MTNSTLQLDSSQISAEISAFRNQALQFDAEKVHASARANIIDQISINLLKAHRATLDELHALMNECGAKIKTLETALDRATRELATARIHVDAKRKMYNDAKDHFNETKELGGLINSDGSAGGKKDRALAALEEAKYDLSAAKVAVEMHSFNLNVVKGVKLEVAVEIAKTSNQASSILNAIANLKTYLDMAPLHVDLFFRSLALADRFEQYIYEMNIGDANAAANLLAGLPTKDSWDSKYRKEIVGFMEDPNSSELREKGAYFTLQTENHLAGHLVEASKMNLDRLNNLQSADREVKIKQNSWIPPEMLKRRTAAGLAAIEAKKWEEYHTISKWGGAAAVAAPIVAAGAVSVLPIASGFTGVSGGSFTMSGIGLTAPSVAAGTGIAGVTQTSSGLYLANGSVVGGGTSISSGTATSASGLIIPNAGTVGAGTSTAMSTSGTATTVGELILPSTATAAGTGTAGTSSLISTISGKALGEGSFLISGSTLPSLGQSSFSVSGASISGTIGSVTTPGQVLSLPVIGSIAHGAYKLITRD